MKKLAYVNTIRGIAILIVLVSHVIDAGIGTYMMHPITLPLLSAGHLGVQLFFILSAFTLFRSHVIRLESDLKPITSFYMRRLFRIAPLFYVAICYYLWQNTVRPGQIFEPTAGHIFSSFIFLNNFNPRWVTSVVPGGWTIGVEGLFYMLLPLLFKYIKSTANALNLLLITLLLRLLVMYFLNHHQLITDPKIWNPFLYFTFTNQAFVFAFGVLMFFVIKDNYHIRVSPISLLLLAGLILIESVYDNGVVLSKLFYASVAMFLFCLTLSKYQPNVIVNPILNYIGKISYSVYLIHFAVIYWMERLHIVDFLTVNTNLTALLNLTIRFLILLAISLAIGTLTYRFIETPFIKLGERLISKRTTN